jgi:hypothetical protein
MADFGLFIGFGSPRPGREVAANTVFGEAVAYWTGLQQSGEIERFEIVFLAAHGGDLGGFFLLRGDAERLGRLRMAPEFERLITRAGAVVDRLGVVPATLDAEAGRWAAEVNKVTADLL